MNAGSRAFILDYTDCQLRLGLLRWLIPLLPSSGKGLDALALSRAFDAALYRLGPDGRTQLESFFSDAINRGISPHLGIQRAPKGSRGPSRSPQRRAGSRKTAVEDIFAWGGSMGFLTEPSVRLAYALTKDGFLYQKLIGNDTATAFAQGRENPFLLPDMERRFLFIQEVFRDPVLLPFIIRIADAFPVGTKFVRTGEQGKKLVSLLVDSFHNVHGYLRYQGLSRQAQTLKEHISNLLVSIGQQQPSLRQRAIARGARGASNAAETFKMAKHRLTPRLEHLADYGLLEQCSDNSGQASTNEPYEPKEFCWRLSETGGRAADFLKTLPKAETLEHRAGPTPEMLLPALDPFLIQHCMEFFRRVEYKAVSDGDQQCHADIFTYLKWAYDRCAVPYGYTEFRGLAIVAGLRALEFGKRLEIGHFHDFLVRVVPKDNDLSKRIRFAGRPEPEKMHIRILPGLREGPLAEY